MKHPEIFNPDLSRIGTQDSQMYNLVAGELVTQVVKTSFGPRGMLKVYIDILGEETITKHGGAFLRKLDVDHPAAKSVVDAVNTVDNHAGDGTIATAILIGALLKRSRELRKAGIATPKIIRGFEAGMRQALGEIGRIKFWADRADRLVMLGLARTCMSGKAFEDAVPGPGGTAHMIVDAVCRVSDFEAGRVRIDDIKIEEKTGRPAQTELVAGTVIDKPIDCPAMPRSMRNARVLLLNEPLEKSRTKTESEISITSPCQMREFLCKEEDNVARLARKVIESGAGMAISRKGIDEQTQNLLAEAGIITVRRVKYNDLWWLERATGAKTCENLESISASELGFAGRIYERKVGGDAVLFVESPNSPRSVTLLLRASSKRYLDEFHRTALNVMYALRNFIERPYLVFGGGSCEMILARSIREKAAAIGGAESLAVEGFANALEEIPLTLASNLGMNRLDVLPILHHLHESRAKHANGNAEGSLEETEKGTRWYGIDSGTRSILDMSLSQVVDVAFVKEQMIKTAAEAACSILNIDDVFVKDLIDNTHCHIDGTVHAHKDPGRNHNHWEQEGLEQRQMHHYY